MLTLALGGYFMTEKARKQPGDDLPQFDINPESLGARMERDLFSLCSKLKEAPTTRKAETLLLAIDLKLWLRKMNCPWADELFLKVQHTYYGLLNDKTARTAQEELENCLALAARKMAQDPGKSGLD